MLSNLEEMEEKNAFLIEQIDYKLEYGQLIFYGQAIDEAMISGYVSSVTTSLVMIS
jgi:hypothetical protein